MRKGAPCRESSDALYLTGFCEASERKTTSFRSQKLRTETLENQEASSYSCVRFLAHFESCSTEQQKPC
jgi:hypothetical protein